MVEVVVEVVEVVEVVVEVVDVVEVVVVGLTVVVVVVGLTVGDVLSSSWPLPVASTVVVGDEPCARIEV